MSKPKIIAFYLPQFHPTPSNDKWWGKGFTEWTNVGKAKPLFKGHYQPKVPADLGYYDLRLPEVREAQAELAKEAGIYGFCYYHYWFGNGHEELELPFNEVLKLGKPDFPFMLCWANDSWHRKKWDKDSQGASKEVLAEQLYPGEKDHISHFDTLLPAFKDSRYIRIQGKPAFMIYSPQRFPDIEGFIKLWNKLALENGLEGITFIAHIQAAEIHGKNEADVFKSYIEKGFSFINVNRFQKYFLDRSTTKMTIDRIKKRFFNRPNIADYNAVVKNLVLDRDIANEIIPTLYPNWDHTPRSGNNGLVIENSTPKNFKAHLKDAISKLKDKDEEYNYILLKSWNEWGEGNYVEPDLKYGKEYLDLLAELIK